MDACTAPSDLQHLKEQLGREPRSVLAVAARVAAANPRWSSIARYPRMRRVA